MVKEFVEQKEEVKKRYWLQWGVYGVIVGLISILHFGLLMGVCHQGCNSLVSASQWLNPQTYIFRILNNIWGGSIAQNSYYFAPVTFGILGAIIGYIYGKMKNRKQMK